MTLQADNNDIALVLTTLASLLAGASHAQMRDLPEGWEGAAETLAKALRAAGVDDDGAWDRFEPEEEEPTFTITRFFRDPRNPTQIVKRGLILEEVQDHCSDPESSSSTATSPEAQARTAQFGDWFDGFEKE